MKWFIYFFALILVYGSESFPTQPLPPKGKSLFDYSIIPIAKLNIYHWIAILAKWED